MSNGPWTDMENDLIVADYFAMLADDIAGRPYNKAEHRRALLPLLNNRTEGSVEFKHQNISAVLKGLGEEWISGINHAIDRHREGIDKAEAIEEGIGVAVAGTLKATVDIAEMSYKVATSRPSRFLGRQVMKAGKGIGRAIEAAEERARQKEEAEKRKT